MKTSYFLELFFFFFPLPLCSLVQVSVLGVVVEFSLYKKL